jgi:hypothetical protein
MKIHLVIIQPEQYVHSLGFLDTADYLKYWLERLGNVVTIGKNRLRHDSVNILFGAHLGVHPLWLGPEFCTYIFNLEQVGPGGALLSDDYLNLLRTAKVIDYHPDNVANYRPQAKMDVPLIPFFNAPHLNREISHLEWSHRPIDLLFFGSVNAERKSFLQRIERAGRDVAVFDSPTYYEERDHYVRQAKAVINISYYTSARFEQVRAFNVLSQGTALISYLLPTQVIPVDFSEPVFWINDASCDRFFSEEFASLDWCRQAEEKYKAWINSDPSLAFASLLSLLEKQWSTHQQTLTHTSSQTVKLVQFDDGSYFHDAVNISPLDMNDADLNLDLCEAQTWPLICLSRHGKSIHIEPGQLERVVVQSLPQNQTQWSRLLTNAFELLRDAGILVVELPIEEVQFSTVEPCRVPKAQSTLMAFSEQFWRSGLWSHRLEFKGHQTLNDQRQVVEASLSTVCRLIWEKRPTTSRERTLSRVHRADFGIRH